MDKKVTALVGIELDEIETAKIAGKFYKNDYKLLKCNHKIYGGVIIGTNRPDECASFCIEDVGIIKRDLREFLVKVKLFGKDINMYMLPMEIDDDC